MKKIFVFVILIFILGSSKASVADLFTVDKVLISSEMTDLNELETFVSTNKDVNLKDVQTKHKLLVINILSIENNPNCLTSILQNSYTNNGGGDSCMAVAVCACCVSSLIGGIYYYISFLDAIS